MSTSFVFEKSHIVLKNQQNWPIARKELIAAVMSERLLLNASNALQLPDCALHAWCDSKVFLQWIRNPDLRLSKFIVRQIDVIHHLSLPDDWNYCSTDENPADVATRPVTVATSKDRLKLWLEGPEYLKNIRETKPIAIQVKQVTATPATTTTSEGTLQHLIEAAPDWYTLKKRVRYLMAFTKYFCKKHAKNAGDKFAKPRLDAAYLDKAEKHLIAYVQRQSFGPVMEKLSENSPDCFEEIIKKLSLKTGKKNQSQKYLKDLRTLQSLRPRLRPDGILCVEGRLEAADLPTDEKNPLILPFKHASPGC